MTGETGEAPLENRAMLAFGTATRDGVELVRQEKKGTVVVLGWSSADDRWLSGDPAGQEVTSDAIRRAAHDDNATILNTTLDRIIWKRANLASDPTISTTEQGSRHIAAQRYAVQTGHPVIAVSEERQTVTLFLGREKYLLHPKEELSAMVEESLRTLDDIAGAPRSRQDYDNARELLTEAYGHVVELGDGGWKLGIRCERFAKKLGIDWPPLASTMADDVPASPILDRRAERARLRTRLTNGPWGVVQVEGTPGVGKTALVNDVLDALSTAGAATRVARHDANAIAGLDVRTLVDYVVGAERGTPGGCGSSLVMLENELRRHGDSSVVIAIDSAENLSDSGTRCLIDPELDDALEMIATETRHRVTVLLVTRHELHSSTDRVWPAPEDRIPVPKLPQPEFEAHLASLDRQGTTDLSSLREDTRAELYRKLRGNARMAELAYGTVAGNGDLNFGELTNLLRNQRAGDVRAFLTRLLIRPLSPLSRRVLQALAAFDTPVPHAAVVQLLTELDRITEQARDVTSGQVSEALAQLTDRRVVCRIVSKFGSDQYSIPPDDGALVLESVDNDTNRFSLYFLAAKVLGRFREKHPRKVADLRVHLAEVRALLHGKSAETAYGRLEKINDILQQWNRMDFLLPLRLEFRERLVDGHRKMANENALGYLYALRDRYDLAAEAYDNARRLGGEPEDDKRTIRVLFNRANMHSQMNETDQALNDYQFIIEYAKQHADPQARMAALEGMADCYRRHGRYAWAIGCAEEALAIPELEGYPDTPEAHDFAVSRTAHGHLKLARWYGELGWTSKATAAIDAASHVPEARRGNWLYGAVLDGRANDFFNNDDLSMAAAAAQEAVTAALAIHDPIILLQARTTLCLVYLKNAWIEAAGTEIAGALRYRRKGRELVVLALSALAAEQRGDHGSAYQQFGQLLSESSDRLAKDPEDFAAWDFKGVALCGKHLDAGGYLDQAVDAFKRARDLTPPTPALEERLRFLLTQLDGFGGPSRNLRPAIDALAYTDRRDS